MSKPSPSESMPELVCRSLLTNTANVLLVSDVSNYNLKTGFRVAYKTSLVLCLFVTKAITAINSVVSDYVTDTLLEKLQGESIINSVLA